ncbi:MAG: L-fucose/L-arabinose isomerase family protein [Clostridia bacterium]|nr:L-fucose/L-arabinose isomerase family protein [Clostridia bacterium]
MKNRIRLAYCPTRRDVFSREEAIKYNELIRKELDQFPVEIIDLEGINKESLLYQDCDIQCVIDRFLSAKVDAIFFPHCNFGSENRVAQIARALNVPVLLWGPRDDAPNEEGFRSRDSQCGLFATGKVLRRHKISFTYLTNSWIHGDEWKQGFEKFIRTVRVVKAVRNLNILQISTRPEPFCSVICNENELIEKFNIHLYPITLNDVMLRMQVVKEQNGADYQKTLAFVRSLSCGDDNGKAVEVAALKVAMKELAAQYNCRAIAIQCWTSLQEIIGIMPCFANAMLTDEGIPTVCETDIHGAITAVMMQAVNRGQDTPFFADVTVRHPEKDNAELLWHCGNFPYSLAKHKEKAHISCSKYHGDTFGIGEWELKDGELTIARFDGDKGEYRLLIGEAKTTTGPKNLGCYVWIEVDDWAKWEHKLVEGPYIHHVCGVYGRYGEILLEACKYINGLEADPVSATEADLKSRWY